MASADELAREHPFGFCLMQNAYFASDIKTFLAKDPNAILGELAARHSQDLDALQRSAWTSQIKLLMRELVGLEEGWISFEFSIPRMGRRTDNVVLFKGVVFVLEFKVGAERYDASARDQVMDYALDLKNFHSGSHQTPIVPIVVATNAPSKASSLNWSDDGVAEPIFSNGEGLGTQIAEIAKARAALPIEPNAWVQSGYKPTPTIIEAAQALYQGHQVVEITRSDAGAINLSQTADCISEVIEMAKASGHKAICFVTGVPGAGKTLAGLNLATQRTKAHGDEHAVFLSGNGPLVDVLREALARDEHERSKNTAHPVSKSKAASAVKSFVQNIMHFRDANLQSTDAPIERVAIFDEAQRAWDQGHLSKFMTQKKGVADFSESEPEFLIGVMDRHIGWCTVVCLIGGGQEINSGEAGLTEWFAALKKRFNHWKVYTSKNLAHRDYHWGQDLAAELAGLEVEQREGLHLAVSIRSFRAEKLSEFVGAVVAGEPDTARDLHNQIKNAYPIKLTRSLEAARAWLKKQARGSERIGLVASSGASRLKPVGLNVHEKIDATHWFLNGRDDVRSSYYLEDPATEFDIQGLEIDWAGVCWDADLRSIDGAWSFHRFSGTRWQNVNDPARRTYLTNAYRVLLTRARQGMVIFVPVGDAADSTRAPAFYDGTVQFLMSCGIEMLN